MIYLVSNQAELFPEYATYGRMTVEKSLEILKTWEIIQADSETTGRDPHICDLLCFQFGNRAANIQLVVDTTTVPIETYKEILESKLLILQNAKFDLQFLFKHGIIARKIYDTMVVEQLLHLGYNPKYFHCSLQAIVERRLGQYMDKTVRGEITWRGLDTQVIEYSAHDVELLEDIRDLQLKDCEEQGLTVAAQVENAFLPAISYLEWCGIKLDIPKWQEKMKSDQDKLNTAKKTLNDFVVWLYKQDPQKWKRFAHEDLQGDLFNGFSDEPVVDINWSSSTQVIPFVKLLGFNTETQDKDTGETKDSVVEKLLAAQKGVNDGFLKVYLEYQEAAKVVGTYGQSYIDAVNPLTGRIHTVFRQLGCSSGRMSCGGGINQHNEDLAKFKKIPASRVGFVQLQNVPADDATRGAFVPERGNLMCSCDFSALESRLGADIYQEQSMINEYLHGSGDIHSLVAKACFPEELNGIDVKDVKDQRPDLRKRAKPVEFSQQFGGSARAIQNSLGCSKFEADTIAANYAKGFPGISAFKKRGSEFVRSHGYVVMCQKTGHKMYWEDWSKWAMMEMDLLNTPGLEYVYSKKDMDEHRKAAAKWDRMALNAPTQG